MKCYFLDKNEKFDAKNTKIAEVDRLLADKIDKICKNWQIRVLKQEGSCGGDDVSSVKEYESLSKEQFVVCEGEVVGYCHSFKEANEYVSFDGTQKVKISTFDDSEYEGGGAISRGFVEIVPNPDTDANPYSDHPHFHSQAEYDDHIKWQN